MQDEPNSPPPSEPRESEGYPRWKYNALLAALIVILIILAAVQFAGRPTERSFPQDEMISGDLDLKVFYVTGRDRERRSAVSKYRRAARSNPSFYTLRRLVIAEFPQRKEDAIEMYARIEPSPLRPETRIESEASMWRRIHVSEEPIPPDELAEYESAIYDMDLGWHQNLALADLYEAAGRTDTAQGFREIARASARSTVGGIGLLMMVLFLLIPIGIWNIGRYISAKKRGLPAAPVGVLQLDERERSRAAGYLLEVFVVSLLLYIGISLAVGAALPERAARDTLTDVLLIAAVFVLWGAGSLAYLGWRLRRAGWTWKLLGFTSGFPGRDILWGVGAYAAALPLVAAGAAISRLLLRGVDTEPNPIVPIFMTSGGGLERFILLMVVVVGAPFFEEALFRGALLNSFRARWGATVAIVLSSIVFAALHPLPLGFLPIFAIGVVLAVTVYQRGSLLAGMVTHALHNGVIFLMMLLIL